MNKAAVATAAAAVRRGSRARFAIWVFHFALPIAGLWLLLALRSAGNSVGDHPRNFWWAFAAAALWAWLALAG